MIAEDAFLGAIGSYLLASSLTPTPTLIGVAEPLAATELPALVLSLVSSERVGAGLGERAAVVIGALSTTATVNLSTPTLPADPTFVLLDPTRRVLTLPHGGLVRDDGSTGPFSGSDVELRVDGNLLTLAAAAPGAGQYTLDPMIGRVTFGAALPPTGTLVVRYFLGQWEQRVQRLKGILRVDACAGSSALVAALGEAVSSALLAPSAKSTVRHLDSLKVLSLSSIGPTEPPANLRRRRQEYSFAFEHEINSAESSGGVIQSIPIATHLTTN